MPDGMTTAAQDEHAGQDEQSKGIAQASGWRLHRHADYQRVYKTTRKQFAPLMTYFAVPRRPECSPAAGPRISGSPIVGPRIGLTAGRVLGNAVERNRIKRRMRAAVRQNLPHLTIDVDLVLHPKRNVLEAEFDALTADIRRIFLKVEQQLKGDQSNHSSRRTTS
jgi:ribonuclease P protein component